MAKTNPLRFDDFVSAVRSDPAQSEPLILLAGYLGRSDGDGKLRIYSDASLNNWHEAAEEDVVHSSPIADSPLGGSNVWLRGTATITPGAAAPLPPEPSDDDGRPEALVAAAVRTIPECTQMCMPTLPPQCMPTTVPPCMPITQCPSTMTPQCMPSLPPHCMPTIPPQCMPTMVAACFPASPLLGAYAGSPAYLTQSGCPPTIPWTTILCQ